ncbi:MAG: hypothetical protein A2622_00160 [Bdellovibrionales bacterium RIFCSPHIGHO2_01_FULL_40_29]|nr:MAG: hypothetical protein A2622_00160 [Bdellovibrionales bacterium RIFCSPHIGHO2_01_FULL_40_29]OFZ32540.1 MAG: hypothetical protein A3D17_04760 [Bdellovibrionales bacterium RIFCSPHIGHO2_02_FULL_40_15]
MKIALVINLVLLVSSLSFAGEFEREVRSKICQKVLTEYTQYLPEDFNCESYHIKSDYDGNMSMTFPMCGDWMQYVNLSYEESTGLIVEGSFGDASEDCKQ